jgi:Phosphotransferase enzyme family
MHDRTVLGVVDLPAEEFAAAVDALFGRPVQVLASHAEVAPYDLPALTTAGRFWVHGIARTDTGLQDFAFFVKHVQTWVRSPLFAIVPDELREFAATTVPWRTEPLVYRSDLGARLPDGLRMPRAAGVYDVDEGSASVWMEVVSAKRAVWDVDELAGAAYRLGRLAASRRVGELNRSVPGLGRRDVRAYADGRVAHVVVPMLMGDAVWAHPLVADTFDRRLRDALRTAAGRVPDIVAELEQLPFGNAHGDACTRNLLRSDCSDDIVLIDFAFWGMAPFGLDLGQLVLGEVQLGERDAACLPAVECACLPAYVAGMRDEGSDVPEALVRRGHALLMLLFSGLSAVPFEHLDRPATPELRRLFRARAACARFILDLVASTS